MINRLHAINAKIMLSALVTLTFMISTFSAKATCILEIDPPQVTVCIGQPVFFNNLSYGPNGNLDASCFPNFSWTAPGSNTPNWLGPQLNNNNGITYNSAGTYYVTLYSVDTQGNISTNSVTATVTVIAGPPSPVLSVTTNPLCPGDPVTFSFNSVNGNPVNTWTFDPGDGNGPFTIGGWQTGTTYFQGYALPGQYVASLCATNECGTLCNAITVTVEAVDASFTYTSGCNKVIFTPHVNNCPNSISSYSWNFGDNTTYIGANPPSHTYPSAGTYNVTQTIVTTYSNTPVVYSIPVTVIGPPSSAITGAAVNNCGYGTITYTSPCVTGIQYTWSVSTGGTGMVSNNGCQYDVSWPAFSSGGTITLTAFDPIFDCSTTTTLDIPGCCQLQSHPIQINNCTSSWIIANYGPYMNGNVLTATGIAMDINGIITIDVPIIFKNCDYMNIGPNAKFYINPNQSLVFDNCQNRNKCEYMWDGIYIADNTASLKIVNHCVFQQARNVVVSQLGGPFTVEDSELKNDYKGIVVGVSLTPVSASVRNTDIDMPGTFLPAISPPLPFFITKTLVGVEIDHVPGITIGDGTNNSYENHFDNIHIGVQSNNSITKVYNCRFTNIGQLFIVPNSGTAIYAQGGNNLFYQPSITVGSTQNQDACNFNNVRIGLDAKTNMHVNFTGNKLINIRSFGVNIQDCPSRNLFVNSNLINNSSSSTSFGTGIVVKNVPSATVMISDNHIFQSNASVANMTGIGIQVMNNVLAASTVTVIDNKVTRNQYGIWVQNFDSKLPVVIGNNKVTYMKPVASIGNVNHFGINLLNCGNARVDYNDVSNTITYIPNASVERSLVGVNFDGSIGSTIVHNKLTRMGSGIQGSNGCNPSTLGCNTLDQCYDGFYFNNADIGQQVTYTIGNTTYIAETGNTWTSTINKDIAGSLTVLTKWYYKTYIPSNSCANAVLVFNNNSPCHGYLREEAPGDENTNEDDIELKIYPNPTSGEFYIGLKGYELGAGCSVDVYDMTGNLVKHLSDISSETVQLDLADMPAGIYLVKVSDGTRVETKPVVKE